MHSLHQFAAILTDTSNLMIALGAACLTYGLVGLRRPRRVSTTRLKLPMVGRP